MQDYNRLRVFHLSNELVPEVYKIARKLPSRERFQLRSQIERSSTSIPTNIVEGCGRKTKKDKAHFFQIAYGSACELEYQIRLLKSLGFISDEDFTLVHARAFRLKKVLQALVLKMRSEIE